MLRALTLPTSALASARLAQMYRLMQAHYDEVDCERFAKDLAEKDRVILLLDPEGVVQGFTTVLSYRIEHPTTHRAVRILYSGDTVIDRRHWGSQALAFEWIHQAGREKARYPRQPLFWFLISKGPRTYRYLSAFSRHYWPHHARQTPQEIGALMHALAARRFGSDYRPERGVVHFPVSRGQLRRELAGVHAAKGQRPDIDFFLKVNPGYVRGDELVCLTELCPTNLKPLSRRVFDKGFRQSTGQRDEPCLETTARAGRALPTGL